MSDSCDPMDCSLLGSSVHGILQARILEWVAISYSRGSSRPRDQTLVSCVSCSGRWIPYHCTIWEAPNIYGCNTNCEKSINNTEFFIVLRDQVYVNYYYFVHKLAWNSTLEKTKIMVSSPITSWQIERGKVEAVIVLFSWAPKSLWTVTIAKKLKDACLLEGKLWQIQMEY